MKQSTVTIRINIELRDLFTELCERRDTTISSELRAYMRLCVEESDFVAREYKVAQKLKGDL